MLSNLNDSEEEDKMEDVKHSGYLKKFKTMKKKYFVLRIDNDYDGGDDSSTSNNKARNGPSSGASGSNHTGPLNTMDTNSTATTTLSSINTITSNITTNSPSNAPNWKLEYYDSEKKFKSRSTGGKKLVRLRECFSINRKFDSKNRFLIALYTDDDVHTLVADTEKDMEEWLHALNEALLQGKTDEAIYTETGIKKVPRPQFSQVWQVTITKRALGATRNMIGTHRICLAKKSLHAIRVDPHSDDPKSYEFPLSAVRRCGHSEIFFFLELGRAVKEGPGELWMRTEDSGTAQNMHEMILSAMRSSRGSEDTITQAPVVRPRSASQSDQSKASSTRRPITGPMAAPLPPSVAGKTPDSAMIVNPATTPSSTSNSIVPGLPGHVPLRDRCDSLPTRSRTNSETKPEHERELTSHQTHLRHHSTSIQPDHLRPQGLYSRASFSYSPPAANSLLSPTSDACSTESFGSSLSDDLTEGSTTVQVDSYQYTSQHFSGLPSEPPIKEEDTPFDDYLMMDAQTNKNNSNSNDSPPHHYSMHHHHHLPHHHHHIHDPVNARTYALQAFHDTLDSDPNQTSTAGSNIQGALSRSLANHEAYSSTAPQTAQASGHVDHSFRKDSMGDYMPVLSPVGSTDTATTSAMASHASSRRSSGVSDHTRSVSCCEPNEEAAYVPMAPGSASVSSINTTASMESHGFSSCPPQGYLDMAPLSSSLPKSDTHLGASPPKSFFKELKQEFHLEKVKSYFSPMEEEEDPANSFIKPVRAYSIGARPQISASAGGTNTGNLSKSHIHGGHHHRHHHHHQLVSVNRSALQKLDYLSTSGSSIGEEARVRAYSCGAQAARARAKIAKPSIESELGVIKSIEPELKDSKKSSSAPLLEGITLPRARSATVGSRLTSSQAPTSSVAATSTSPTSVIPGNSSISNLVTAGNSERDDDFFVVDYGKRTKSGSGSSWSGKNQHPSVTHRERKSSMTSNEPPTSEAGRRFSLGTSAGRPRSNSKSSTSSTMSQSIPPHPSGSAAPCDPSSVTRRENRAGSLTLASHKIPANIHPKYSLQDQQPRQHHSSLSEASPSSIRAQPAKKPSDPKVSKEDNDYLEMAPAKTKPVAQSNSSSSMMSKIPESKAHPRKVFGPLPPSTTASSSSSASTLAIKPITTGPKIPSPTNPSQEPLKKPSTEKTTSPLPSKDDAAEYVRLEFTAKGSSPSFTPSSNISSSQHAPAGPATTTNYSTIIAPSSKPSTVESSQSVTSTPLSASANATTANQIKSEQQQINPPSSSPSPSPSSMSSAQPQLQKHHDPTAVQNPQSSGSSLSSSSSNSNSSLKINTGPSPDNASDYMNMTIGPGSSLAASVAAKSKGTPTTPATINGPNPSKSMITSSKMTPHQLYRRQVSGSPSLRLDETTPMVGAPTSAASTSGQGFTRKGSCPSNLSAQGCVSGPSASPLSHNPTLVSPVPVNRSTQNLISGLKGSPSPEQGLVMDQSRYFQSIATTSANLAASSTSTPCAASTSIIYENVNLPGSATNSRPSSVGSERELNYVALDLAPSTQGPISETSEDSPRSLKSPPCPSIFTGTVSSTSMGPVAAAEGPLGSTGAGTGVPSTVNGLPASAVTCSSPSAPLTYAQIDFKKSEGLRNATNNRIQ